MSAPLETLTGALDGLRRALDCRDAAAIIGATRDVGAAVYALRRQQTGPVDPEVRARLEEVMPIIESMRMRVNVAADDVRKRMSWLAQKGVDMATGTYGR